MLFSSKIPFTSLLPSSQEIPSLYFTFSLSLKKKEIKLIQGWSCSTVPQTAAEPAGTHTPSLEVELQCGFSCFLWGWPMDNAAGTNRLFVNNEEKRVEWWFSVSACLTLDGLMQESTMGKLFRKHRLPYGCDFVKTFQLSTPITDCEHEQFWSACFSECKTV